MPPTTRAPNEHKARVERFWLLYTPVWASVVGLVMIAGWAEHWGDAALLTLGAGLGLPAVVGPVLLRRDRERAWYRSTAFKMGLSVVGLAVGLNYTQTPFFWDVLHMHYGFQSTWNIDNNPVFLYLLTIAYFASYAAGCLWCWRWLRSRGATARALSWLLAPLAMALSETLLNANPFTTRLFCYDDMQLMLGFGTLAYGIAFILALPMWAAIDETQEAATLGEGVWTAARVLVACGAVLYADLLVLDLLRHHVAPHLTVVEPGAVGLRDYEGSCLAESR